MKLLIFWKQVTGEIAVVVFQCEFLGEFLFHSTLFLLYL